MQLVSFALLATKLLHCLIFFGYKWNKQCLNFHNTIQLATNCSIYKYLCHDNMADATLRLPIPHAQPRLLNTTID